MKVSWYVASLEKIGGGERFVLEATKALEERGVDITVIADTINSKLLFNGKYNLSNVICTNAKFINLMSGYFLAASYKLLGVVNLYQTLRAIRPNHVVCQSEYDAIKVWILSKFFRYDFSVFVFGQMFQFAHDNSKYSTIFRAHLNRILSSRPGYSETVVLPPPKLGLFTWILNEIVSILKYRALRSARFVYALSPQVKWEVELLYGRGAQVLRAAFPVTYIDKERFTNARIVKQSYKILSVCRIEPKKRVDLIIDAFNASSIQGSLTIIGSGSEFSRIVERASLSKRSKEIHILGLVSDEVLAQEVSTADCFISMDVGDFDISVAEAMGKAVKVIVPKDFDVAPYGESFTGLVCVDRNVKSLSLAISNLPNMPSPSLSNLESLSELTWDYLATRLVNDFYDL